MARTKSPSARRKSSSKKAGGDAFDLDGPEAQLVFTIAAVLGITFLANGMSGVPTMGQFLGFFKGNGYAFPSIPVVGDKIPNLWPFGNILITAHVIKSCQRTGGGGFWANSFLQALLAAFASPILSSIVAGNGWNAVNESQATLVLVVWYLMNHDIPFVGINAWDKISGLGGAPMQNIIDVSSLAFTTNLTLNAASAASGGAGFFGFAFFAPCVAGVVAGCAGDFFPLNKGVSLSNTESFERASWWSFYLASNGLAAIPFAGQFLGQVTAQVAGVFGGNANFALFYVVADFFFNKQTLVNRPELPFSGWFYDVFGLNR